MPKKLPALKRQVASPILYYRHESMVEDLKALWGDHTAIAVREGVGKVSRILAGYCHEVRELEVS